jgi:hypothetical protein
MSHLGSNPYLLNIVPLFNVADPTNGLGDGNVLTDALSNVGTMVDTTNRVIYANGFSPYSGIDITITGAVNIEGSLDINGVPIGADANGTNLLTGQSVIISTGTTSLAVTNTSVYTTSPAIQFITSGSSVFEVDGLGRALYKGDGVSSNTNRFWVSSSILHADRQAINYNGLSAMSTIFDVWGGDSYFDKSIYVKDDVHCTTLYQISDKRLKSNITPLTGALSTICQLQGVHYDMMGGGKPTIGFIAQEVGAIVPEAVTTMPNGLMAVDYSRIVPLLVEAIKELVTQREV